MNSDDVSDNYFQLCNTFLEVVEKHAPIKKKF